VILCEVFFVQKVAFVAEKKSWLGILTSTQQEIDIHVATSLDHLSVNLRPDF